LEDRIYFAHTVNSYNTDLERRLLMLIQNFFGVEIENPNQPHHQLGYRAYKIKYEDHPTKSGMDYFYEEVLPRCNMCICQIFLDRKWGAGVAHEAAFFLALDQPVWIIDPDTHKIRLITEEEKELILDKDPSLVLSIEETRFRIWGGKEPYSEAVPYGRAHLLEYKD